MRRLLALFVVLLAIAAVVWVAIYFVKKSPHVDAEVPASARRLVDGLFTYEKGHFAFNVPADWQEVMPASSPGGLSGAEFEIRRADHGCAVQYVRTLRSLTSIPPLKQISWAERLFTDLDNTQFDSDWWILASDAPAGVQFSDYERQPLAGEMRIVGHPDDADAFEEYRRFFVLYQADGQSVPDVCDAQFSEMLKSFRWVYVETSLTAESSGVLYARQYFQKPLRILFKSDGGNPMEVIQYQDNAYAGNISVHRNKIFLIAKSGILGIDPFSKEPIAAAPMPKDESIIDYLFLGDELFHIAAPDPVCMDMGRCSVSLYRGSLQGMTKVASSVKGNAIIGYDPQEDALYMRSGYGDAGCFNSTITRYSFKESKAEEALSVGGCYGEEGFDSELKKLNDFLDRFKPQMQVVQHIDVEGGKLIAPKRALQDGGTASIRFMPN